MLDKKWSKIVSNLDFAFQPIANIHSGEIYAVEALLRNFKEAGGFYSIFNLFDEAFHDGVLYQLDLELRLKVIKKFSKFKIKNLHLFYNLDNRILYMPDFQPGNTDKILEKFNVDKALLCFELSERGTLQDSNSLTNMVRNYKRNHFKIAIDDFGTGISGFQMLYFADTDFIKIDRFFIQNIQNDHKKRLFCSHIIDMAHIMGIRVIAEGIETKEEYYTCKEIGADLLQGYFLQKPKISIEEIKPIYKDIKGLYKNDLRSSKANQLKEDIIEYIESLYIEDLDFEEVFDYFKKHRDAHFIPIIDKTKVLQGVLHEHDVRELSYSPYGLSLASNDRTHQKIKSYIDDTISAEYSWSVDEVLEIYSSNKISINGIFILKNGSYMGFVTLHNLLKLSYDRNIEIASQKNPLTKLSGNISIDRYLFEVFENSDKYIYTIVYFDFNNFKPFNDVYGFRLGDRAILLFSEILKKHVKSASLIGHIGGDDFFVGFKDVDYRKIYKMISYIQEKFKNQVSSLYNQKDRNKNHMQTKDRFGIERKFDLLSVSAAIIEIHPKVKKDDFNDCIGKIKKESKMSDKPIACSLLPKF